MLIGAGNLATNLGKALAEKGFSVTQVYSRTEQAAKALATQIHASFTTSLKEVEKDADLYIVSLSDTAFCELIGEITAIRKDGLFVHTAGSLPLDKWKGYANQYGVFYPLQTFSKERRVDFSGIPVFLEASSVQVLNLLEEIARELSEKVFFIDSDQRKSLHLAAVFVCNFTNHMYTLGEKIVQENNLSFEMLLPLIDETSRKISTLSPRKAQTGPAVRYDENIICKHLELLKDDPASRELYEKISANIHKYSAASEE